MTRLLALRACVPLVAVLCGSCASSPRAVPAPAAPLAADTPSKTLEGNSFVAPAGWTQTVRGAATILEAPEGGSRIALVDVRARDAEAAVQAAWAAYGTPPRWPLKVVNKTADRDGWTDIQTWIYQTSPNERREVEVSLRLANGVWTAAIYDMAEAVGGKRLGQVALIFGRLLPKGRQRESFAGRTAHRLDGERIARLTRFVETAREQLRIPGVSVGLIERGQVVYAGGSGVRELGGTATVDADTLYLIASNTKALTTLMLAQLVDEGRFGWETPVTAVLPSFRLGDADTTGRVLMKHLICACTGMPRQDYEWLFQFQGVTPEGAMATLATMQPTSKFGELFQYSNLMAAAAGYAGGHAAFPALELGPAYDQAMQSRVFGPLGMKDTTFDFARALAGNHAMPHAPDVDGTPARATMEVNYAVIPVRPAGAAWSSVRDVLRYVAMELAEGTLPGGERYVSREALLARRAPQVRIGQDETYGMGLMVDTTYGTPVVHHGGDLVGFHSDMMWLPEHGVGAVVLTNGNPGWILRTVFRRKLLEVLFDGNDEADARVAAGAKAYFEELAAERRLLAVPADAGGAAKLAARYANAALGEIAVQRAGGATAFDFGEWRSEMASRRNPDGSVSFVTVAPGVSGLEFVVGNGPAPTLVIRDAQHEYTFTAQSP